MTVELRGQNTRPYHRIGKYQVLAHVATGGMGVVYRALDAETGQVVALKVLSPAMAVKPVALERFRREAAQGAKLRHENLVSIHEFYEANDLYFLALDFVEGIDLHEYITTQGCLDPEEARYLLEQAASALDYLHSQGVVHRDVKPANFLITYDDEQIHLKLTDLGLARDVADTDFRVTRAGNTVGTIDYMAPEQARDSGAADIRSDIYALGCTLYHMLAGRPPFAEGGLTERLYKHAEAEPPDVRDFNPRVPAGLVYILRRMMAKKPADRFQTPAELLDDVEALDLTPVDESSATATRPAPAPSEGESPPTVISLVSPAGSALNGVEPEVLEAIRAAAAQYDQAQAAIAEGNADFAVNLLLNCCRMDRANIAYRDALRRAGRQRVLSGASAGWRGQLAVWALKAKVKAARQMGDHVRVLEIGEEVLARSPDELGTEMDLAEAADQLGLEPLAFWMLQRAWRKDRQTPALNRALARIYERRGSFKEAAALWKLVSREQPDDAEAHTKATELAARETIARGRYQDMIRSRESK